MEFLKDHLGEELYNQVTEALKDKSVKLTDLSQGGYVAKKKFDDEQEKVKTLTTQLQGATKDLDKLKGLKPEEKDAKIADMQKVWDDKEQEYQKKITNMTKNNKIRDKIMSGDKKPNDINDVLALLDTDKISLDGDNLVGFDDQYNPILEKKTYLYNEPPAGDTGGGGNPSDAKNGTMIDNDISAAEEAYKQKPSLDNQVKLSTLRMMKQNAQGEK